MNVLIKLMRAGDLQNPLPGVVVFAFATAVTGAVIQVVTQRLARGAHRCRVVERMDDPKGNRTTGLPASVVIVFRAVDIEKPAVDMQLKKQGHKVLEGMSGLAGMTAAALVRKRALSQLKAYVSGSRTCV